MRRFSLYDKAAEEVDLILSVMKRSGARFARLAPAFTGLGTIWLIVTLLGVLSRLFTRFGQRLFSFETYIRLLQSVFIWIPYFVSLFELVAFVVFLIVWARRLPRLGIDPLASRLAVSWGVFLIAYLVFHFFVNFGVVFLTNSTAQTEFYLGNDGITYARSLLSDFNGIAFLAIPLMLTAITLRNRRILVLSLIYLALLLAGFVLQVYYSNPFRIPANGSMVMWIMGLVTSLLLPAVFFTIGAILKREKEVEEP